MLLARAHNDVAEAAYELQEAFKDLCESQAAGSTFERVYAEDPGPPLPFMERKPIISFEYADSMDPQVGGIDESELPAIFFFTGRVYFPVLQWGQEDDLDAWQNAKRKCLSGAARFRRLLLIDPTLDGRVLDAAAQIGEGAPGSDDEEEQGDVYWQQDINIAVQLH